MEIQQRRAISDDLKKYCYFAKDGDYIEITEWTNGEGWDICINGDNLYQLTSGQLDAINYLINSLSYNAEKR